MKQSQIVVVLAGLALACGESDPTTMLAAGFNVVPSGAHSRPFSNVGDCSRSTLIEPGTIQIVDDLTIIKGRVFDCPASGDIAGVVRVSWRNAVFGPGPEGGHVAGKTTLFVQSFFGQSDLEGTFEGAFSASLVDLLAGTARLTRAGTGDFHGMVMHGVFFQSPPASNVTFESGVIVGR